jgi:hypothetical protein
MISAEFKNAGLFPIVLEGFVDRARSGGLVFSGDLNQYIETLKVLNASTVFVQRRIFDETMFIYIPDEGRDKVRPLSRRSVPVQTIEPVEIYLDSILPSLADFRSHVGEECAFRFFIQIPPSILDFYLQESWFMEFTKHGIEAIDKVEEDAQSQRLKAQEERGVREQEFLNRLREFINDTDFLQLPTQKAMLAYAMDKIPGLDAVDEATLKIEIQNLAAKSKARSLVHRR